MDGQTIVSGLARVEALLTTKGPEIAELLGTVADTLAGPSTQKTEGYAGDPTSPHLGTRLHAFADMLEGLLGVIGGHTARSAAVVGVPAAQG